MIEHLDKKLLPFIDAREVVIPQGGWINAIRTTLNMTLVQLGNRLSMTRQGVKSIELSEANGSISINRLKDVANAMDLKLVYALIPNDASLDHLIQKRAEDLSRRIVLRTNQHMKLEDQGIGDEKIQRTIQELTDELKREMKKSLWD